MTSKLLTGGNYPRPNRITVVTSISRHAHGANRTFTTKLTPSYTVAMRARTSASDPSPLFGPLGANIYRLSGTGIASTVLDETKKSVTSFAKRQRATFHRLRQILGFPRSGLYLGHRGRSRDYSLARTLPSRLGIDTSGISLANTMDLTSVLARVFLLRRTRKVPRPK